MPKKKPHNAKNTIAPERDPFHAVYFSINECCDAFDVLEELHYIHSSIITSGKIPAGLFIKRESLPKLIGTTRDSFCVRMANLFDKRKDVHSLKKYFGATEIDTLENHAITKVCKNARNGNICHMGKKYVKWPDVEEILASEVGALLKNIRAGILSIRPR